MNPEEILNQSTTATGPKVTITMEHLLEAMAKMPPPTAPKWKGFVVKPSVLEKIRRYTSAEAVKEGMLSWAFGAPIYTKTNQVADCWVFEDENTLGKYLDGELSEAELVGLAVKGSGEELKCPEMRGNGR